MFSPQMPRSTLGRFGVVVVASIVLIFLGLAAFRVLFVNKIDNYELGYKFDLRNGKIEVLLDTVTTTDTMGASTRELRLRRGYMVTLPFLVKVHTIDLRPMQVCINANARVLNCKLVKFNPAGFELFLSYHGRGNYDGGGLNSTSSSSTGTTKFNQILMSYAYEGAGRTYPFLEVLRELKPGEVSTEVR